MKPLTILGSLVILAYGRPEPSLEHQHPSPEQSPISSYFAPLASVGPLPTNFENQPQLRFSTQESLFSRGFSDHSTSSGGSSTFSSSSSKLFSSGDIPSNNVPFINSHLEADGLVVRKEIYINLPPPEVEQKHRKRVHVKIPPPERHYNIIFIKTPSPPVPALANISPLRQEEEKTLVYVLVKEPEEQPVIKISTPVPTKPSKPEIYFIKYQTEKEKIKYSGNSNGVYKQYQASDFNVPT